MNIHYLDYKNGKREWYGDLVGALKELREERRKSSKPEDR